ncbi:hypothetical protein LJR118_006702 [Acidovorax sp. LjRoot118]|uniref:hypothetical protein n=1 Tax=Acidovorax sp. LjRoot118 TaxID=3342256 RepID=UPI003ECF17A5
MTEGELAEIHRRHRLKIDAAEVIERAFRREAQLRKGRTVDEWHQAEVEAVWTAASDFGQQNGLRTPSIEEVSAVERLAFGHSDYGAKWALYVAETIVA